MTRRSFLGSWTTVLLVLAVVATVGCTPPVEPADLVLRNGTIVTLDDVIPEAETLVVRGDRIVAVGRFAELQRYVGDDTQLIDLEGSLAIPGFIEGHGHLLGLGDAQLQLDLSTAASWDEVVVLVADATTRARPGELVRGRGWHQDKWDERPSPSVEGLPVHDTLSAVSPDNPVLLTHASGHATFANASAMALAGVDDATPDPPGGTIVRDPSGRPTGAFRETASRLLAVARRDATPPDPRRQAALAVRELLEHGITSFQDAGASFETVDLYRSMVEDGSLDVRLWVMLRASNEELADKLADYRVVGQGDHRLTVRAIKHQIDGALGSHGAWLLEPYEDLPDSAGLNTTPIEVIEETARLALAHDYQLAVHAIGDRANRETLDLFARAFDAGGQPGAARRWRIEHAQHLHPDDIPRFAELGVIASMQGKHATSDGSWVPDRIGDRRAEEGAYVWRRLLDAGVVVSNGTDAPVEPVSPILSYHATVSRRLGDGSVFYPEQRLSRLDALRTYTLNAAYAAFEEDLKGSLTPGKLADIAVLSRNILTVPESEIPGTEVLYTVVGGRVMYRR